MGGKKQNLTPEKLYFYHLIIQTVVEVQNSVSKWRRVSGLPSEACRDITHLVVLGTCVAAASRKGAIRTLHLLCPVLSFLHRCTTVEPENCDDTILKRYLTKYT